VTDNIVEIAGRLYLYSYENGETVYKGPVSDSLEYQTPHEVREMKGEVKEKLVEYAESQQSGQVETITVPKEEVPVIEPKQPEPEKDSEMPIHIHLHIGDVVSGDKVGGDKVAGDKVEKKLKDSVNTGGM
jgi:hypothetical protein